MDYRWPKKSSILYAQEIYNNHNNKIIMQNVTLHLIPIFNLRNTKWYLIQCLKMTYIYTRTLINVSVLMKLTGNSGKKLEFFPIGAWNFSIHIHRYRKAADFRIIPIISFVIAHSLKLLCFKSLSG